MDDKGQDRNSLIIIPLLEYYVNGFIIKFTNLMNYILHVT